VSTSGQSALEFQSLANSKLSIFNVSMRKNDRPSFDTALSAQVRPRSQFPAADCLVVEAVPQSVLPLPNERHRKLTALTGVGLGFCLTGYFFLGKGHQAKAKRKPADWRKLQTIFFSPSSFLPASVDRTDVISPAVRCTEKRVTQNAA
jgi:hypothetical protein